MNNTLEYNIGFYVGRFQPFTKAHELLIRESIKNNDLYKLIIFFGSVNPPSNFSNETAFLNKNPYNMKKREKFLKGSLIDLQDKLIYDGMLDYGSPKEEITAIYLKKLQKK
jgi:nicotinamide mononucleotide adenylyltransferase